MQHITKNSSSQCHTPPWKTECSMKANLNWKLLELEAETGGQGNQRLSAILNGLAEQVCLLMRAEGVAIALSDAEGVTCQASTGLAPAIGSRLPADSGLTRECYETGQVVLCEDAENDPRIRASIAKTLHLRSAIAVPIVKEGVVLGAVLVFSSRSFAFDETDIAALQRMAESVAAITHPEAVEEEGTPADSSVVALEEPALVQEHTAGSISAVVVPWGDATAAAAPAEAEARDRPAPIVATPVENQARAGIRMWLVAAAVLLCVALVLVWVGTRGSKWPFRRAATSVQKQIQPQSPANRQSSSTHAPSATPASRQPQGLAVSQPQQSSSAASSGLPDQVNAQAREVAVSLTPKPVPKQTNTAPMPALVIEQAPAGAQVFIDDRLATSTNSAGQAIISNAAPGQHRVRITVAGYRDYEREVDVEAGRTSELIAKLEAFQMPLPSASMAPSLGLTPALPPPLKLVQPDFELNRTVKGHSSWVTGVGFSRDGQQLVSASWDQTVKRWNAATGAELSTIVRDAKEVQAIAFSRDGHWLATENSSNTVILWDDTTGRAVRRLEGKAPGILGSSWVYSIAFSPDGRWLASGLDDKIVRVWDVQTGATVRDFVGSRRPVIYTAFSPDGRRIASGLDEKTIAIWDVTTGREIQRLSGHKKQIYAVVFSPDGRWLASAGADKTVRLWDVSTGHEIRMLSGHRNIVTSLAFSADGRWLASGSWDNTVKIWNAANGQELQTLSANNHHVYSIAFDTSGKRLASGSEDGTIKLWRLGESLAESKNPSTGKSSFR
jgi:WD40 repeat protein